MKHLYILSLITVLSACTGKNDFKHIIHHDFETRKETVGRDDLYSIFDSAMTTNEREAMEFLYAYMPQPDMTDYTGQFYLDNIKASLKAREEMPWGMSVPEREFKHFVLPVRINNENLDSSRIVFYAELKERVKGLSMTDAILEINHWCHEKVTYRPSDIRTSSPLTTIRAAFGRCGEESTFTVAALRAMGIPARQVYTPRWAHTDDNHAWVEAWADGKWYFLGACEPEPVLNMGWFNEPASRGMMMNTKVMGRYDGPEEQLGQNNCFTEINVTANYAPVVTSIIQVVDTAGNAIPDARVEFKLYNYGEFYSIATKMTDDNGNASLTTGLGDMLVWASHGENFGFAPIKASNTSEKVTVVLDKGCSTEGVWEWDMVPPAAKKSTPTPDADAIALNNARKATEDSIRASYMATFVSPETNRLLALAAGNYKVISDFFDRHSDTPEAIDLIEVLAIKDLTDITIDVLEDHINTPVENSSLFVDYILNPRIANEMLTPYKSFIRNALGDDFIEKCRKNPLLWVEWCSDSISIDNTWNPQSLRMSPRQVYTGRVTDSGSRDIFFVAGARAMGIPSRIDQVTGKPQYADKDEVWHDAQINETTAPTNVKKGSLALEYSPSGRLTDPGYYYHFTLSLINGMSPQLLNYPDESPLSTTFGPTASIDAGQYVLVTGQRLANGTVLSRLAVFNLPADNTVSIPLILRQDTDEVKVIGSFNSENLYLDIETDEVKSLLSTTGRGYYVIALVSPNHEPTIHALNDISQYKDDFEKWGGKIVMLFKDKVADSRLDKSRFPDIPSNIVWGTDVDDNISKEIAANMNLDSDERPVFLIADTFNRIVYMTQGYTIGLGERLIDTLYKVGH